ncbi:hypothetical protein DRQ09_03320 [candidate division KSB1 bacterium]|nr:MAG: hypothetical protein DRQ09_03320 [candidate division KSB1 bacterium]
MFVSAIKRRLRSEKVELEIYKKSNKFSLEVLYPERRWYNRSFNYTVDLSLIIPEESDVDLESTNGTIEVYNISGEVSAESLNGKIIIKNVVGKIYAKSLNGRVSILKAKGRIDCESLNREIRIEDSSCEWIKAESMNGKIFVETTIDTDGVYDFESTNGDITIYIPEDSRADIIAEAPKNRFFSDFEIEFAFKERRRWNIDWRSRKITGKINGGGARISISTLNGDIDIRKK